MEYFEDYALSMYNEQKEKQIISKPITMEETVINFDRSKLSLFKAAFEEARKRNEHYFMFDGHEFFLGYAKYAIEYLENQFNLKKQQDERDS